MLLRWENNYYLNILKLLETLCKNCSMAFLRELNNKRLIDALLKIIEKVEKLYLTKIIKASLSSKIWKTSLSIQRSIENKSESLNLIIILNRMKTKSSILFNYGLTLLWCTKKISKIFIRPIEIWEKMVGKNNDPNYIRAQISRKGSKYTIYDKFYGDKISNIFGDGRK